jgi:hypothetical protein
MGARWRRFCWFLQVVQDRAEVPDAEVGFAVAELGSEVREQVRDTACNIPQAHVAWQVPDDEQLVVGPGRAEESCQDVGLRARAAAGLTSDRRR